MTTDVVEPSSTSPTDRKYYAQIFLVAFATLLLEISYTRVISFKLFYYFTYLVIGLALLGLGAGGVAVAISKRLRGATTGAVVFWGSLASAAVVPLGYVVVAWMNINTLVFWDYGMPTVKNGLKLIVICLAILAPFLPAGVVLSTLFSRRPEGMGRLYCADLLGAGLACLVVVPLLSRIGPPGTIMIAALAFAVAAASTVPLGATARSGTAIGVAVVLLVAVFAADEVLPSVARDLGKATRTAAPTIYSSWSPLFRVDVVDQGATRTLEHDGLVGSIMRQWDGRLSSLDGFGYEQDVRQLPFALKSAPPKNVAIIGAAAGNEVQASLHFRAKHIDAVEINPVTYGLVTKTMAGYLGHLANHPGVAYHRADGRSFMARSSKHYDLIWLPAPDSYSATNASTSSAFVLSESYLYTSDALVDYLNHTTDNGIVAAQFGEINEQKYPNRTARYINTAIDALHQVGVKDPRAHFLVSVARPIFPFPGVSTILMKKTAFTPEEIRRFESTVPNANRSRVIYTPTYQGPKNAVNASIELTGAARARYFDHYPYSVGAISDDRPFFWHFSEFDDVFSRAAEPILSRNVEVAVGERALLLLLLVACLLAVVFLLLPFFAIRRTWRGLPRKRLSFLYFAGIGFGFIFLEITLIQRFVLFLGYPTYSLTVTLASMLIFLGVGSLLSSRLRDASHWRRWLPVSIVALFAFYLFGLSPTTNALLDTALWIRIVVVFSLLAPLGICLGMFMPIGVRAVAALTEDSAQYVAWGWAVNGFASVIGSVLATIIAMTFGFQVVLYVAFAIYVVAMLALHALGAPLGKQRATGGAAPTA